MESPYAVAKTPEEIYAVAKIEEIKNKLKNLDQKAAEDIVLQIRSIIMDRANILYSERKKLKDEAVKIFNTIDNNKVTIHHYCCNAGDSYSLLKSLSYWDTAPYTGIKDKLKL